MAAEHIQEVLQYELRTYQVGIQVNQTKDCLTVVINRPRDAQVNYSELTEAIVTKLKGWNLEVEKFKILGRIDKQPKPEWQQVFNNPHAKGGGLLGLFGGKGK
jgi:hypothetical protein